jgi:ABC-type phosphate transport system auxiliary subunit
MEVLVALLALIGFLALIAVCGVAFALWLVEVAEKADPDPYREGLDASARITAMAFEAERAMHQIAHEEPPEE